MNITGAEVKELVDELRRRVPMFGRVGDRQMADLVTAVLRDANATLRGIEERIAEAGSMPGDAAAAIMVCGAVYAVISDMPRTEERRSLLDGGEAVGRLVAKKYADKIGEELQKKEGVH